MAAACASWLARAAPRASPRRRLPQRQLRLSCGWSARSATTAVALATVVVVVVLATAMIAAAPAALVAPGVVARAVRAVARVGSEMTRE